MAKRIRTKTKRGGSIAISKVVHEPRDDCDGLAWTSTVARYGKKRFGFCRCVFASSGKLAPTNEDYLIYSKK
jgi:hypothetical protein